MRDWCMMQTRKNSCPRDWLKRFANILVGDFIPATSLHCTISALDENDAGHSFHQDFLTSTVHDRDEAKKTRLGKNGKFTVPRLMEHLTVQTWVLQSVTESIADLVTKQNDKSSSPILETIECKPNSMHCQHQTNNVRCYHGAKERNNIHMNSNATGAKRAAVRSVSSLDANKRESLQRIVKL